MSDTDDTAVANSPVVETTEPAEVSAVEPVVEPKPAEQDFAGQLAELRGIVQELQTRLDSAVLEAEHAKRDRDALIADTAAKEAAALAEAELERLREERLLKVGEVASFPETYIKDNVERWAAMSEAEFAACLTDWAAIGRPEVTADELPRTTVMKASHDDTNSSKSVSTMREVMDLTLRGVDPRTL